MKIVIAGGGTGGHLFPGIAVAEELVARGHQVRFVGTARGIEARVCPRDGWELDLIDVAGLKGGGLLGLLKGLYRVPRALLQSRKILRREKPDLVIGVGGYASGPMVLAAALGGVPTAILEQNSVPGITNRILGRVVRRVFGSFAAAERFFPRQKYALVGNPVRGRVRLGLAAVAETPVERGLLVVGGSQGARKVNELVAGAMERLQQEGKAPRILHQTGEADQAAIAARYATAHIVGEARAFIDDMASAYRGARLAVTRAGASTLAELTALGVPSILIPLPTAADDHQTVNAAELADAGAAVLSIQKDTTPESLAALIGELLADEARLGRMSDAARRLAKPHAHRVIVDALEELGGVVRPHVAQS